MNENNNSILKYAKSLMDTCNYEKCISYISKKIDNISSDDKFLLDLLLLRGDVYRKFNKLGDALRDYRKVVSIDENNQIAKTKICLVENILSIENTFYYENAYTDSDLFSEI